MVREAEFRDLDELLELYLHLHDTEIPEKNDHLRTTWDQILQDEKIHVIVYEDAGRVAASCCCTVIPNLARGVRPYAFVENVVTHPVYRGKGYATQCLAFAKKIAEEQGCYKIMLMTGSKDPKVFGLYEHLGYNSQDKKAYIQWL